MSPLLAKICCFALPLGFFFSLAPFAIAKSPADASAMVLRSLQSLNGHLPDGVMPASFDEAKVIFVRMDPDDPWTLGIVRALRVNVPKAQFQPILDDVSGYVGIFKDLLVAQLSSSKGPDDFVLFTETEIPAPLIANDRTSVHYRTTRTDSSALIDCSLVESNHLKALEGASLLARQGDGTTSFWKSSFISMGFGASRVLPPRTFWTRNALGGIQSDWALKLRAEQSALPAAEVLKRSEAFAEAQLEKVKEAYDNAESLEQLLGDLASTSSSSPRQSARYYLVGAGSLAIEIFI